MAQLTIAIGCDLCGVIPLGDIRATVGFTPDKKSFRARLTMSQVASEGERLSRALNRWRANDFRQKRFATIG